MDCQETFKCEDDCDNHKCPTWAPKPKQKKQPKTEPQENFEGEGKGTSGGKGTLEALELRKKNKNEMFPCFYFRSLVVASRFLY